MTSACPKCQMKAVIDAFNFESIGEDPPSLVEVAMLAAAGVRSQDLDEAMNVYAKSRRHVENPWSFIRTVAWKLALRRHEAEDLVRAALGAEHQPEQVTPIVRVPGPTNVIELPAPPPQPAGPSQDELFAEERKIIVAGRAIVHQAEVEGRGFTEEEVARYGELGQHLARVREAMDPYRFVTQRVAAESAEVVLAYRAEAVARHRWRSAFDSSYPFIADPVERAERQADAREAFIRSIGPHRHVDGCPQAKRHGMVMIADARLLELPVCGFCARVNGAAS